MIEKPWGHFKDIVRTDKYVLKTIHVKPREELSLQFHNSREEFWVVLEGKPTLKLQQFNYHNEQTYYMNVNLNVGATYIIKKGQHHQLINNTDNEVVILELQFGENCSEEDIVRITDKYKR